MDYSSYETLQIEKSNKVATVTLNRPERLNAVNGVMHNELERFFGEANSDSEINAIVLTGAGRAFRAGGDISRFRSASPPPGGPPPKIQATFGRGPRRLILNLLEIEAPVIV